MTTKNNLITGILIGVVLIIIPIILISTSTVSSDEEQNNYKFYISKNDGLRGYLLNLKNGELWAVYRDQKKLVEKVEKWK